MDQMGNVRGKYGSSCAIKKCQERHEERTEREHKTTKGGKQTTEQLHTHTHLEHLEDFEEASVWEEGAVADRYAVPTPESQKKDGLIFWCLKTLALVRIKCVRACINTCLYTVMVGPFICSPTSCSLSLLFYKKNIPQNTQKIHISTVWTARQ